MGGEEQGSAGATSVNPYAAPAAELPRAREPQAALGNEHGELYVVGLTKFYVLSVFTFGLYSVYWFYAQFKGQRRSGMKTKPALAAFFSIFTAHRLFARLDRAADRAGLTNLPRAKNQTAPYVAFSLIGYLPRVVGDGNRLLTVAVVLVFNLSALPLARVQQVVNHLASDPDGNSNARFGPLNIVSIAIGAILWLVTLLGLVLTHV